LLLDREPEILTDGEIRGLPLLIVLDLLVEPALADPEGLRELRIPPLLLKLLPNDPLLIEDPPRKPPLEVVPLAEPPLPKPLTLPVPRPVLLANTGMANINSETLTSIRAIPRFFLCTRLNISKPPF
jgi:hypothetical protein